MFKLKPYADANGYEPFSDWYRALRDRTLKKAVDRRMQRVELGNFGDCKPCGGGVWELRVDLGPGHRVYYALAGKTVVLLLCAGSKGTQQADIAKAAACWKDWKYRHPQAENDDE